MILTLYITRRFALLVGQMVLIFFGILILIDMVDQLRRFSGTSVGLGGAARLAALNVPESLYRILPLIFIFAAITLFLGLARSSELVVIRAAGRSGVGFVLVPVGAALILGGLAVAVLNPIVAGVSREYEAEAARLSRGGESVLSLAEGGLWLRQDEGGGQAVINAARADGDGTRLFDVNFLTYSADGSPERRILAAEAVLSTGAWDLTDAKTWDLTAPNPERSARTEATARLPSNLTPARIRDSFGAPSSIPIWELPGYIARIEAAGFTARTHRVWFQMELAQPLLLAAMVLVAAGFTMRHMRGGGTGALVLMAVLSGFAIFFLRNFAQVLGESGQIPVALAAWSPPVAATLMAFGLLLHLEDG